MSQENAPGDEDYLSKYKASRDRRNVSTINDLPSDNAFKTIHYKVVSKLYGSLREEYRISL